MMLNISSAGSITFLLSTVAHHVQSLYYFNRFARTLQLKVAVLRDLVIVVLFFLYSTAVLIRTSRVESWLE